VTAEAFEQVAAVRKGLGQVEAARTARRSALDGRRSARPALSSSSTVTTIVVLSSPTACARSVCENSPCAAVESTHCARGVTCSSSSAACISVASAWLVTASSQFRLSAGAGALMDMR